jgi:PAS domain S-box-containing protein
MSIFTTSEAFFNNIEKKNKEALCFIDLEGIVHSVDETFADLSGYTLKDLGPGIHWATLFADSTHTKEIENGVEAFGHWRGISSLLTKAGNPYPVTLKVDPCLEGTRVTGLLLGITSLQLFQEKENIIRKDNILLREILDTTNDAIFIIDNHSRLILDCNARAIQMFGFSHKAEITGLYGGFFHKRPFSYNEIQEIRQSITTTGKWQGEVEYNSTPGTMWGFVFIKSVKTNGFPVELVQITDITERKLAEEALSNSRKLWEEVFNNSADGLLLANSDLGYILDCNKVALSMLAIASKQALSATDVFSALNCTYLPFEHTAILEQLASKGNWNADKEFFSNTKKQFWGHIDIRGFELNGSKLHLIRVNDITHRYKALEKERLANEVLEQKVAERTGQLSASEERWKFALEGNGDGVWDWNIISDAVYLSPQWKKIVGYADDELTSTFATWEDRIHPDDKTNAVSHVLNCMSRQIPVIEQEYRLRHKDGSYRWVKDRGKVVETDAQGDSARLLGTISDITTQKQAQEELAVKDRFYKAVLSKSIDGYVLLDARGYIIDANDSYCKMSGFSQEELLSMTFADLETNKTTFTLLKELKRVMVSGSDKWESLHKRKDGSVFVVETSFNYLPQEGRIISCFIRDATRRKKVEQEVQDSHARYRFISENIRDIIAMYTTKGICTYISPSVKEVLGYSPEDALDHNPVQYIHPDDLERVHHIFRITASGQKRSPVQYRLLNKAGKYLWVESSFSYIMQQGKVVAIQSATRDIHDRKMAEQGIQQALEKEKELNELKSRFVSIASHEFRTPLTSIQSSVEILQQFTQHAPDSLQVKYQKHFTRVKDSIKRMTSLMDDLLNVERLQSGTPNFYPLPTDPVRLISEVLEQNFFPYQDGRFVNFLIEGKPRQVALDANCMTHILTNLLSNAFKYSPGKPNPELRLQFQDASIQLIVTDQGIGIPEEDQKNLFNSFFRAHNTGTIPGTGLGMVIAMQYVKLHGGDIEVQSSKGAGSCFTVTIPAIEIG